MFGRNPPRQQPPPGGAGSYSRIAPNSSDRYADPRASGRAPNEKYEHTRAASRGGVLPLHPAKSPNPTYIYGNMVAVSPNDFPQAHSGTDFYVILNDLYVSTARVLDGFPQGTISLSDFQRSWASISLQDTVYVKHYDPFQEDGHRYLGSLDVEVGFAGKKQTEAPFDQDELQQIFTKVSMNGLDQIA